MEQFAWYKIVIGIVVLSVIIMGILFAFSVDKDDDKPIDDELVDDDKSKHFDEFTKGYKTWINTHLKQVIMTDKQRIKLVTTFKELGVNSSVINIDNNIIYYGSYDNYYYFEANNDYKRYSNRTDKEIVE